MAGAFDNLGIKRSCFFAGEHENDDTNFIEKLIKYGNKLQQGKQVVHSKAFLEAFDTGSMVKKPDLFRQWRNGQKLFCWRKRKTLIGIYLSAHPLDDYRLELENFCSRDVSLPRTERRY